MGSLNEINYLKKILSSKVIANIHVPKQFYSWISFSINTRKNKNPCFNFYRLSLFIIYVLL